MEIVTWEEFFEGLSQRAKTALRAQGVGSFESLEAYRLSDLLRLSQLGKTTANEISVKLARIGRSLAASPERPPLMDFVARETAKINGQVHEALQALTFKLPMRDLFAMAALAGSLACPESSGDYSDFAERSYLWADAMMAARDQKKQEAGCA